MLVRTLYAGDINIKPYTYICTYVIRMQYQYHTRNHTFTKVILRIYQQNATLTYLYECNVHVISISYTKSYLYESYMQEILVKCHDYVLILCLFNSFIEEGLTFTPYYSVLFDAQ